jgi:glycosyltransferase involved in cell wall biosynthesis
MKTPEKVSVIIPFRNSIELLTMCLRALETQSHGRENYEVIAVDNGSTVDFSTVKAQYPWVIWLFEAEHGSYAARNRGLRVANGSVIAFTDADCKPAPDWIEQGVRALSGGASIIGGKIEFETPPNHTLNMYELYEQLTFDMTNQKRTIETRGYAATANVFTSKSLINEIGQFDKTLKSGGDKEWGQRAVKRGARLMYCSEAQVQHPRRGTYRAINDKVRRICGGQMMLLLRTNPTPGNIAREILFKSVFNPLLYFYALRCRKAGSLWRRLCFTLTVACFSWTAMLEKIKILLGDEPYRGQP